MPMRAAHLNQNSKTAGCKIKPKNRRILCRGNDIPQTRYIQWESAVSNYIVQHLISVNTDRNAHFTLTHCSMWNRKTLFHRDYIKGDDIWHASGLNRGGAVRNVWLRHRLQGPAAVGKLLAQVGLIKINAVVWLVWQWWSFPRSCNG